MRDPSKRNVILDWLFGAPVTGDDPARRPASRAPSGERAFQPFGYTFQVRSPSPPSDVKVALRSRMKGWFDVEVGARGWIIGPFVCLWFSAFDRHGPILFARLAGDKLGTSVVGRAGSDLDGLALFTLLIPLLAFALYMMVSAGDYMPQHGIIIGGLILLSPLVFWWSHEARRDAEPLVRFVRDAIAVTDQRARAQSADIATSAGLTLTAAGDDRTGPTTGEIHDALLTVGADDFVILARGAETYIQTAFRDGGYLLEMRDGDSQRHYQARRHNNAAIVAGRSSDTFTFEELHEVFFTYASEASIPPFLVWERMHLAA